MTRREVRRLGLRRVRIAAAVLALTAVVGATPGPAGAELPAGPGPGRPVVTATCADPSVTADPELHRFLLVCTGESLPAITERSSTDLVHWSVISPGLFDTRSRPTWARGDYWGPQLVEIGPHDWRLYFTARTAGGSHAIGVARAASPEGPFIDSGSPLISAGRDGVIDPFVFSSGGVRYIVWKTDGNSRDRATTIRIQRLSGDGMTRCGPSHMLIRSRGIVEAPVIVEHGGSFYLLVSEGRYDAASYQVRAYRSDALDGAWEKAPSSLLVSNRRWYGPGSITAVAAGDATALLWEAFPAGTYTGHREVFLGRLAWGADGWPSVAPAAPLARTPAHTLA